MSSSNVTAYLATVVYQDHDRKTQHIAALILAVNERDAIDAAVSAVRSLSNCAEVIGGALELYAPAPKPAERESVAGAGGQTLH
jgi:hypothetical protein